MLRTVSFSANWCSGPVLPKRLRPISVAVLAALLAAPLSASAQEKVEAEAEQGVDRPAFGLEVIAGEGAAKDAHGLVRRSGVEHAAFDGLEQGLCRVGFAGSGGSNANHNVIVPDRL